MSEFDLQANESFELALYRAAEAQIRAGHHFLAVVTAQAAVEAVAQSVFTSLFGLNLPRSLETMDELLPDRSFMAKGTRMLWRDLTGDDITSHKDIWKPYSKHVVERRNPSAHGSIFGWPKGEPVRETDATESVRACRAMTDHLLFVMNGQWERLIGTPGARAPALELDNWRGLAVLSQRPATGPSQRMAEVIRAAREFAGMTEDDLADRVGVGVGSIRRIESGRTEPRLSDLVALAPALGLSVVELIHRADLDTTD